ncbi:MAG: HK97 family phage prohead protease [Pseudomonadota bacterium]
MNLEFKAALSVDDAGLITGLAWPFGSPDRVGDEITPGAFKSAKAPLPILFAHDPKAPLGAWDSIAETKAGLEVKGRLLVDEVTRAREVRALVKSGAITGLSIGFVTKAAKAKAGGGRTISAIELVEISLVTVPSHPGARVRSAKSAMQAIALADAINRAALALSVR